MATVNLLDLDRSALETLFLELREPGYRAEQIMKWIYHDGVSDFAAMTNLSKSLRTRLEQAAEVRLPRPLLDRRSHDGTRKWLIQLDGGNCIETVFIPETDRGTLCVSSQVGCILDCSFCATARQGFNRNLSTAEIIGQLWLAHQALGGGRPGSRRITNVVLMGMGEPLYNLKNVVPALNLMMDDLGFGLSKRRVTLSTAGVVPQIHKLRELSDVSLAVSLHAPDDALRDQLVPLNRRYPLAELLPACRAYLADRPAPSHITWEYVMLDGVNDSECHARALVKLLSGIRSKVNLIPFNPFPNATYRRSSPAAINRFREILLAHDLMAVTRKTRGEDIAAACGQLAGQVQDRSRRDQRFTRLAS